MAEDVMTGEDASHVQTLKAALHYTVGQICEKVSSECDLTFSKQVTAVLTEVAARQLTLYAGDLEAFARHGRRAIVNLEDVKLLVRRNPYMATHIGEMVDKMEEGKKKKGRKKKKTEEEEEEEEEEEKVD